DDAKAGVPERILSEAEAKGQSHYEGWRVRKDGSQFWVEGMITAVRDEAGRLRGFSKVAHDITAEREAQEGVRWLNAQLEEWVRERTAQLEAANQKLDAFGYKVWHDLRAPLLSITGYIDLLTKATAARLDEKSREH